MQSANEVQVNGTHYRPGVKLQHWDVCDMYLGYLEGYGSKYLMRWRTSPTPLGDIEKSIHIFTKLLERHVNEGRMPRPNREGGFGVPPSVLREFHIQNKIEDSFDRLIISNMFTWRDAEDLDSILNMLKSLLPEARTLQGIRGEKRIDNTGQKNVRGYDYNEEDDGR